MSLEKVIGAKIDATLLRLAPAKSAPSGVKKSEVTQILQTCKDDLDTTGSIVKGTRKERLLEVIFKEMEAYDRELREMGKCFSPAIQL